MAMRAATTRSAATPRSGVLSEHGAAMAEAYVPLSFAPGEAYQFDWSHEVVVLNGTTVTVKVAHARLLLCRDPSLHVLV